MDRFRLLFLNGMAMADGSDFVYHGKGKFEFPDCNLGVSDQIIIPDGSGCGIVLGITEEPPETDGKQYFQISEDLLPEAWRKPLWASAPVRRIAGRPTDPVPAPDEEPAPGPKWHARPPAPGLYLAFRISSGRPAAVRLSPPFGYVALPWFKGALGDCNDTMWFGPIPEPT